MRGRGRQADRLLATVMFTDIVGSTELAGRLGDRGWKQLIARHNSMIRRTLRRFGGRELDTAGDGFFVMFDRPAQAIDCAAAILQAVRPLDLELRVGIHMGEAEVMGGKVGGITVHAASRVMGMAAPGEILVTSIVKDLAAGADIRFEDRGVHELRGIPGEWRIYRAEPTQPPPAAADAESTQARFGWRWILAGIAVAATAAAVGTALLLSGLSRPAPIVPQPDSALLLDPTNGTFLRLVELEDPSEMVVYEGALWTLSVSGRTVIRVDPRTGAQAAVGLPGAPTGIAAGDGALWITTGFGSASGDPGVTRVGATTRQNEGNVPLGDGVDGVAVGDGAVWVTNRITNTLTRIDLTTRQVATELPVGEQPGAVVFDAGWVWVANSIDRTIWKINSSTVTKTAEVALADTPYDLVAAFDSIWVSCTLENRVVVVDPETNSIRETLTLPGPPRGITAGPSHIWVALSSRKVVRIDPADPQAFVSFDLAGAPEDVVVSDAGVWVSIRE